ncbi:4'-phosphopantetheinyl transferase superfamily protein [Streptomyces sp. NPDC002138]|uniref:4'-phosphopantetheinyl transferase family protein n=1 Tax=Streptomyces sp. NPDC002138 TaxID=3154410 RepID=UPI00332C6905
MIEDLVPGRVAGWSSFEDRPRFTPHPAEAASLRSAAPARRREFANGRYCAHRALRRLGTPAAAIPAGDRGAPVWPAEVVGSITHCPGYTAAAVARRTRIRALGIDAETHLPLPEDVLEFVARPEERARVRRLLAERPGVHWDRLLFSAKESVYKTWFPVTGRFLGFHEASIDIDPDAGTFSARIPDSGGTRPGLPAELTGRWRVGGALVVTAIAVPATEGER